MNTFLLYPWKAGFFPWSPFLPSLSHCIQNSAEVHREQSSECIIWLLVFNFPWKSEELLQTLGYIWACWPSCCWDHTALGWSQLLARTSPFVSQTHTTTHCAVLMSCLLPCSCILVSRSLKGRRWSGGKKTQKNIYPEVPGSLNSQNLLNISVT